MTEVIIAHQGWAFTFTFTFIAHQVLWIFQARIMSGLLFSSPVDLPYPGIELTSPAAPEFQADSLTT